MPVADELADDPLEDAYYDYLLRIGDRRRVRCSRHRIGLTRLG